MKYILSLILLIALSVSASAQFRQENGEVGPDTLNNTETVVHYIGGTSWATALALENPVDIAIAILADSLSGANTDNISFVVKGCADDDCTFAVPLDTFTVNGTANETFSYTEASAKWYKYAVFGIGASGTQALKFQTVYNIRRRQ